MNKDNAHLYLPLVKALSEGKTIQIYYDSTKRWEDRSGLDFSRESQFYRIKPEPRVFYANEYLSYVKNCYESKEDAQRHAASGVNKIIKLVEVLE